MAHMIWVLADGVAGQSRSQSSATNEVTEPALASLVQGLGAVGASRLVQAGSD